MAILISPAGPDPREEKTVQLQTEQLVLPNRRLQLSDLSFINALGRIDGETVHIERSVKQYTLKTPVAVPLAQVLALPSRTLATFVIQGLTATKPTLIPFVLSNNSLVRLAKDLLHKHSGSIGSLYAYCNDVNLFCAKLGHSPDFVISDAASDPKRIPHHKKLLEDYIDLLGELERSPGRRKGFAKHISKWYDASSLVVKASNVPSPRVLYEGRAPTTTELQRLFVHADLRERAALALLAFGGFRESTAVQLTYAHIRDDYERNVNPLHIHVSAELLKGKYSAHDTFICAEGIQHIRNYLEARKRGGVIHPAANPEQITNDTPLIRDEFHYKYNNDPRPIGGKQLYKILHQLYFKAGVLDPGQNHYILTVHSIRSWFKTRMILAGVPEAVADYFMAHSKSVYTKIATMGIEHLRSVYASAKLSIQPDTVQSKYEMAANLLRGLFPGESPERYLVKDAFVEPHMTMLGPARDEHEASVVLSAIKNKLKDEIRKEILNPLTSAHM